VDVGDPDQSFGGTGSLHLHGRSLYSGLVCVHIRVCSRFESDTGEECLMRLPAEVSTQEFIHTHTHTPTNSITLYDSILKIEAARISEMSTTLPTSTRCNHPRNELTPTVIHSESLKSEDLHLHTN
jgi:hypothetical protein